MGVKDPRCWTWDPPECPVRVPLNLSVSNGANTYSVPLGTVEGGPRAVRVVVGGVEFESVGEGGVGQLSSAAMTQLAERIELDLKVGVVVRRVVGRNDALKKMVELVVGMMKQLAEGEEEREVLERVQ